MLQHAASLDGLARRDLAAAIDEVLPCDLIDVVRFGEVGEQRRFATSDPGGEDVEPFQECIAFEYPDVVEGRVPARFDSAHYRP